MILKIKIKNAQEEYFNSFLAKYKGFFFIMTSSHIHNNNYDFNYKKKKMMQ